LDRIDAVLLMRRHREALPQCPVSEEIQFLKAFKRQLENLFEIFKEIGFEEIPEPPVKIREILNSIP